MNRIFFSKQSINHTISTITLPFLLMLAACGGSTGQNESVSTEINTAPTVNAGLDQTVNENDSVEMTATASDSDSGIASYSWSQTSGNSVQIINQNSANASFIAPSPINQATTQLTFEITVTDNGGLNASDSVTIMVNQLEPNLPPVVNAGLDQTVPSGATVQLIGTATDSDGNVISYQWSQVLGENVSINNSNSAVASFTAPSSTSENIQLVFQLVASDNENATAIDEVSIVIQPDTSNVPPTVEAGNNQTVDENTQVVLTAVASDTDGTIVSYLWTQSAGTNVVLSEESNANTSFVAPNVSSGSTTLSFNVLVTDSQGLTAFDTLDIVVEAVPNNVPVVNAGSDRIVEEQTTVQLAASASDSDGTIESYAWVQTSGQSTSIENASTSNASFIAPSPDSDTEQLTFSVTVIDNEGALATDTVSITVQAIENSAPTVGAGEDQVIFEQENVFLSAAASDDDGEIISYNWLQTSGNDVTLNNNTSPQANFIAPNLADSDIPEIYTFEVTVIDNGELTASDSISITVRSQSSTEDCSLTISPGTLFTSSFSLLSAGDTLCLNDGVYSQAMDIPNNINVRAVNDGMAELDGGNVRGIEWQGGVLTMSGHNSSVRGLKVYQAGTNSDACTVLGNNNTMRLTSCSHGGQHKHKIPLKIGGSGHLIEDSWFYGEGRYVVQCFGGDNITIRRNVIRWDETIAGEPNEPNASMSNYSCDDMIWENNISLDYGIPATPMIHCGDICMSTNSNQPNVNVQYLGNMIVNHAPQTDNNVAFRADQKGSSPSSNITIKDFYVRNVSTGIVFNPLYENISIEDCTMIDVNNEGGTHSEDADCSDSADLTTRYVDGEKTSEPLFPFAHQALIKADMCATNERQSDWCETDKTLGDYILDQ